MKKIHKIIFKRKLELCNLKHRRKKSEEGKLSKAFWNNYQIRELEDAQIKDKEWRRRDYGHIFSKINKPQIQGTQRTPNRMNLKYTHTQAHTHT